ncbi:dipeptidyl aminopeptidase 3, putative [Plasmodium berghei]|uniref:Dipeptidyl peptidase 1 n=2 Tax=Plasmodium berghei TaxID=5821 RepID=A0A509AMU4_PLABA|nr:dipeptidyl aminopeptidase 3, putative [Plasmodium berghei ANKA]CXI48902.1 dipeptidyl aminopeptidase 3, putative [Plasmodium berghei]SCL93894.1 dipeptidyl aminopeptidase 3, putative [Plasmodium berghei]SCM15899.1 dipeptidyl aminopeptidase 3, putative [Plasmodium berghei]SCM17695.1 dipeptidyl aminopeptidase 3, putative [Plasmodium berghei]SCN25855.1 dipeptidyl aminopeptidase 3, putative [Plasmodium berghei]|eukprot:XP_034421824.1 dipeptidyl aminopeptidase 3, putative [Plasmodium berghei ANKA]
MILIPLFFYIFLNYIKCDIPVHCLSRHVEGLWEIKLGLLKNKQFEKENNEYSKIDNRVDKNYYDYECGYKRPDDSKYHDALDPENVKKRFEIKDKKIIAFNKDRTINIIENGKSVPEYSGYWRIVYDEGLHIEIYNSKNKNKEIYFSFFKFVKNGEVSYSYCSNLVMGVVSMYHLNENTDITKSNANIVNNSRINNCNDKITRNSMVDDINIDSSKCMNKFEENGKENNSSINNRITKKELGEKNIIFRYAYALYGVLKNSYLNILNNTVELKENESVALNDVEKLYGNNNDVETLIDHYNDNFIDFKTMSMKRYCWSGKKLDKNSDKATNKISNMLSPLDVNADTQNHNYYINLIGDEKNKGVLTNNKGKKRKINNIQGVINNPPTKKIKENSLFNMYSNRDIALKNFDWSDENDVKERFNGNSIRIFDEAIDQKECGSCYANSASRIINSRIRIKYNYIKKIDSLSFSNEQLLICDFFNQGCNGGYIYLSLKYAYENYLYTNKCFERYENLYINKDDKNNSLCDRFDTFKIFLKKKEKNIYINNYHEKMEQKNEHIKIYNNFGNTHDNSDNRNDSNIHKKLVKGENINYIYRLVDSGKQGKGNVSDDYLNEDYILVDKTMYERGKFKLDELDSCDTKIKVTKYEYLDIENEENLKKYIYYNGPVAAAIEPSKSFIKYKKGILTGNFIKMQDGDKSNAYIWNKVDHAVVIVGWGEDTIENLIKKKMKINNSKKITHSYDEYKSKNNDNLDENIYDKHINSYVKNTKEKNKVIKYWKVLNSWGTKWGYNGYFYILRDENYFNIRSYLLICDVNLFVKNKNVKL